MDIEPGTRVADRYVVERKLGEGAMGVVYEVRHADLGARYALKLLKVTGESRKVKAIRQRLLTEGRIQARLRHRNIVSVTDTVTLGADPGLVMEWVDGADLDTFIEARHPIALPEVLAIGRGIVRGVRAAHAAGHLHRDLKPANILVAFEDGEWVPKVADFGVAKVLVDDDGISGASTVMGSVLGTPQYMSPEQAMDSKSVDERTDVFALGCILYELCTGARAFDGRSMLEIQARVTRGKYRPPEELRSDLPPHVVRAIRGALVAERGQRTPSCDALLEAWQDAEVSVAPRKPPVVDPPGSEADLRDAASTMDLGGPAPTAVPADTADASTVFEAWTHDPTAEETATLTLQLDPATTMQVPDDAAHGTALLPVPQRRRWPWVLGAAVLVGGAGGVAAITVAAALAAMGWYSGMP